MSLWWVCKSGRVSVSQKRKLKYLSDETADADELFGQSSIMSGFQFFQVSSKLFFLIVYNVTLGWYS